MKAGAHVFSTESLRLEERPSTAQKREEGNENCWFENHYGPCLLAMLVMILSIILLPFRTHDSFCKRKADPCCGLN